MPQVFPSLSGLSIEVSRSPTWDDSVKRIAAVSGKESAIAYWANPRWEWELTYNYLRQGLRYGTLRTELASIAGFFNQMTGPFTSFLFTDDEDSSVTDQSIGSGDGTTASFQLVRNFGGFTEPVLAPNTITNVKVNGVVVSPANYSVTQWGSSTPGVLTFAAGSIPASGATITATFTYYWPCVFVDTKLTFKRFLTALWSGDSIKIKSVK